MKLSVSNELTFHAYIIQAAALASAEHLYSQSGGKRSAMRRGKEEIYRCLGPIYFCCAYWMSYDSFWRLHNLLEVKIEEAAAIVQEGYTPKDMHGKNWSAPPIPNASGVDGTGASFQGCSEEYTEATGTSECRNYSTMTVAIETSYRFTFKTSYY